MRQILVDYARAAGAQRAEKVVELRFFGGCSNGEIAEALGVAGAWLATRLGGGESS